jgi:beta-glucanase (GH16 family)
LTAAAAQTTGGADSGASEVRPSAPIPSGYALVWSDEFEGASLDTSKWTISTKLRDDAQQTADAVAVSDGNLHISYYTVDGIHYTAFLKTVGKFETTYGFFEARIRFRDSPGTHSSFWLQSTSIGTPLGDPGVAGTEIDIIEHRAMGMTMQDVTAGIISNLHWDGYDAGVEQSRSSGLQQPPGPSPQGNFHDYGVLWTPSGYTFYYDGAPQWQSSDAVSDHPEFILLTGEVQDHSWAGVVPPTGYGPPSSSTTGIDVSWVRVWQAPTGALTPS